ncbi:hypothetical protein 3 [Beihai sea slater virus 3]|uniref:hypothetical protein 3 n=1 Tax=Beihai sea slater virus 3 TaxID=1922659 RepID=UPI00090AFC67|nr:hypothetical protein 3 [Beihai sea slater virus 3]APG75986.1 hypothetical protein 3 [Beihai sea slater virus 3]
MSYIDGFVDFKLDEITNFPICGLAGGTEFAFSTLKNVSPIFNEVVPDPITFDCLFRKDILRPISKTLNTKENNKLWSNRIHYKLNITSWLFPHIPAEFHDFPVVPKLCFTMLIYLRPDFKDKLFRLLKHSKLNHLSDFEDFRRWAKELTLIAKKNATVFDPDWMLFVDYDQFLGYAVQSQMSENEEIEKIVKWLGGDVNRGSTAEDQTRYYNDYKYVAEKFVKYFIREPPTKSLRNWILNTKDWVTSGSSRGVTTEVFDTVTSKTSKSRKVKNAIACNITAKELYDRLTLKINTDDNYKFAEKIEPGQKHRGIISASFEQNVRLSFVSTWVEENLKRNSRHGLTMFYDDKSILDMKIGLCRDFSLGGICLPLDASGFDENVSRGEVEIVFDAMLAQLRNLAAEAETERDKRIIFDYFNILKIAKKRFYDVPVLTSLDNFVVNAEHGIPSGSRWTGLLDSIINKLRFEVCQLQLNLKVGLKFDVMSQHFQGDDMQLRLAKWVDVIRILNFYNHYNLKINPQKNFASIKHDEYLRKVYTNTEQRGYLTRRLCKLCFRDPLKNESLDGAERCRERVRGFISLHGRSANYTRCEQAAKEDVEYVLTKGFNTIIREDDIDNWFGTPVTCGGMGLEFTGKKKWINLVSNNIFDKRFVKKPTGVHADRIAMLRKRVTVNIIPNTFSVELGDSLVDLKTATNNKKLTTRFAYIDAPGKDITLALARDFNLEESFSNRWFEWRARPDLIYLPLMDLIDVCFTDLDLTLLITDPNIHEITALYFDKMDKFVFRDWMKNKLKFATPTLCWVDDTLLSTVTARVKHYYLSKLIISKNQIYKRDIVKVSGTIEQVAYYTLLNIIRKSPISMPSLFA